MDDHVLSFSDISSISDFFASDRLGFSGSSGLSSWRDTIVSLHEADHAMLNATTAWGLLLRAVAHLARFGQRPAEHVATLVHLVPRCARTHEAYATHGSVARVVSRPATPPLTKILSCYPAYRKHLDEARRTGPDVPFRRAWRQVAAEAALTTCMQADVLGPLLHAGPEAFTPLALRDRDCPDYRLGVLQERGRHLWNVVERLAAGTFGRQWERLRRIETGHPGAQHDAEAWDELSRLCRVAAASVLAAAGSSTLDDAEVGAARCDLAEAVRHAAGPDGDPSSPLGPFPRTFGPLMHA